MKNVKHFSELDAWRMSHQLALGIYKATERFPEREKFGLVSQMRRCAVSVPSNLAEGFGRFSLKEKANFYSIGIGSLLELESQLLLSKDLAYLGQDDFNILAEKVESARRLMRALVKSIKER